MQVSPLRGALKTSCVSYIPGYNFLKGKITCMLMKQQQHCDELAPAIVLLLKFPPHLYLFRQQLSARRAKDTDFYETAQNIHNSFADILQLFSINGPRCCETFLLLEIWMRPLLLAAADDDDKSFFCRRSGKGPNSICD